MTKHLYIPIALLFAISQQSSAMEILSPSKKKFRPIYSLPVVMDAKILRTITSQVATSISTSQVAKPTSVFCNNDNVVTIFGKNCYGKDIYSLNSLENNKHDCCYYHFAEKLAHYKATKKNSLECLANINTYEGKKLGAALHPAGFIAAFLHYTGKRILYWNTLTQQPITATKFNEPKDEGSNLLAIHSEDYHRIDFSHDGTKLVVALEDKCLILQVPFEGFCNTVCKLGTKNKCILPFWALRNNQHQLPQDIMQLLIENIIQLMNAELSTTTQHCCKEMDYEIFSDTMDYCPYWREYSETCFYTKFNYCAHCKKILPTSLKDQWYREVKKEKNGSAKYPLGRDRSNVSPKFWTDLWWKKRGL